MKKITLLVFILSLVLPARANLMEVKGTFSGAPQTNRPLGPVRLLSGGFTAYFDDTRVPTTGYGQIADLTPSEFFLNDPVIGDTTFDLTNTFLTLGFHHGTLISFLLGDSVNNDMEPGTDDFLAYFEHDGALIIASFAITEKRSGFSGGDFRTYDPTTGSFSVTPVLAQSVPDVASTALITLIGFVCLLAVRRYQPLRMHVRCLV